MRRLLSSGVTLFGHQFITSTRPTMRYVSYMLGMMFTAISCQYPSEKEVPDNLVEAQKVYDESTKIHDEVMPHIGELLEIRKSIEVKIDSLTLLDSAAYADTVQYMQYVVRNLKYADRGMTLWMRNLKQMPGLEKLASDYYVGADMKELDTADIVQIQMTQKKVIEQVKRQIETSIEAGKEVLSPPQME